MYVYVPVVVSFNRSVKLHFVDPNLWPIVNHTWPNEYDTVPVEAMCGVKGVRASHQGLTSGVCETGWFRREMEELCIDCAYAMGEFLR